MYIIFMREFFRMNFGTMSSKQSQTLYYLSLQSVKKKLFLFACGEIIRYICNFKNFNNCCGKWK